MNDRERQVQRALSAPCIECGADSPFGEHQCLAAGAFAKMVGKKTHEVIEEIARAQERMAASALKAGASMRGLGSSPFFSTNAVVTDKDGNEIKGLQVTSISFDEADDIPYSFGEGLIADAPDAVIGGNAYDLKLNGELLPRDARLHYGIDFGSNSRSITVITSLAP